MQCDVFFACGHFFRIRRFLRTCARVAVNFVPTRRGAEQASMLSGGRGHRVGSNGVRLLMGFRPHRLRIRRAHVTFAAAQLASCGASNATPNAQVCALGKVLCPTHIVLFIVPFFFGGGFFITDRD